MHKMLRATALSAEDDNVNMNKKRLTDYSLTPPLSGNGCKHNA